MSSVERKKLKQLPVCSSYDGFSQEESGAIPGCHPSGFIQLDLVCTWIKYLSTFVKPTAEYPVVLILDDHYFHTKNQEVINFTRENHIIMQLLNVAFMRPLEPSTIKKLKN